MARPTTDRLKFNAPLGNFPALQYLLPDQLKIDESYQRSVDTPASQALIRKIAQYWNWDLCQPLVVSRRDCGDLFVIDGQHWLEAARLRGDIAQLPAMVKGYASAADEAASFVHLNQARTPLNGLQIFHAALASEDTTAIAIRDAITAAGLKLGRSSNLQLSPPGTVINVGGINRAWKRLGAGPATEALEVLATAFPGQRLKYAGTLYPGIAAVCAREMRDSGTFSPGRFAGFSAMLGGKDQTDWRQLVMAAKADDPQLSIGEAAAVAIGSAWSRRMAALPASPAPLKAAPAPAPAPVAPPRASTGQFDAEGKAWCTQCEQRRSRNQIASCTSKFCAIKVSA
jgi:hypothetical protein